MCIRGWLGVRVRASDRKLNNHSRGRVGTEYASSGIIVV